MKPGSHSTSSGRRGWIATAAPGISTFAGKVTVLDRAKKPVRGKAGKMPAICVMSIASDGMPVIGHTFSLQ